MNTFILSSTNVEYPGMKLNYRYYHNGYVYNAELLKIIALILKKLQTFILNGYTIQSYLKLLL